MRFLVQFEVYDTIVGHEADRQLRQSIGGQVPRIMGSGKVSDAGFLTDRRGAFFVVDVDAPEELYELFGPEVYGNCRVQASPVAPLERIGELFAQWGQEGR